MSACLYIVSSIVVYAIENPTVSSGGITILLCKERLSGVLVMIGLVWKDDLDRFIGPLWRDVVWASAGAGDTGISGG